MPGIITSSSTRSGFSFATWASPSSPFVAVQTGADRYVWSIHAVIHDTQHEQVLPDALLHGAWRELVDAVRAADTD